MKNLDEFAFNLFGESFDRVYFKINPKGKSDNKWEICIVSKKNEKISGQPKFDTFFCKGCGLCAKECPANAIKMQTRDISAETKM